MAKLENLTLRSNRYSMSESLLIEPSILEQYSRRVCVH